MKKIPFNKNIVTAGNSIVRAPYEVIGAWISNTLNYVVILMDPNANLSATRFNNLIVYDLNKPSDVKYQVDLPTSSGPDCYTEAKATDDRISAFSFSCHRCEIDIKSGTIVSKSFTE